MKASSAKSKLSKCKVFRSPERTKGQLLQAARKLFGQRGFHGATVHEIASEAGVNVSLISHYYEGKEGLYRACIEGFAEARLLAMDRILETPRSKEEFRIRLELFVTELFNFHLENKDVATLLLRDMIYESDLWGKNNESTLFSFIRRLVEYFTEAKEKNYMNSELEPMIAAGILYLTFSALFQASQVIEKQMKISIKDKEMIRPVVTQILDTLWQGLEPR
jgi:AcrR family transcriptional regulator